MGKTGDDGNLRRAVNWLRDPVECVKELIGNPALYNGNMEYAPEYIYADNEGKERDPDLRRFQDISQGPIRSESPDHMPQDAVQVHELYDCVRAARPCFRSSITQSIYMEQ